MLTILHSLTFTKEQLVISIIGNTAFIIYIYIYKGYFPKLDGGEFQAIKRFLWRGVCGPLINSDVVHICTYHTVHNSVTRAEKRKNGKERLTQPIESLSYSLSE